jgi:anti-sigma factor RsiW
MSSEYSQPETQAAARGECAALEPILTAYFDGEASAEERQAARAHLARCGLCAIAWQQWQSTRALFQNAPVPAMPPSLAARLRLACRFTPRTSHAAAVQSAHAEQLLEETLFEAAHGLEPEPFSPVLRAFFEEVAAPPDLRQRILQQTVGATKQRVLPARDGVALTANLNGIGDMVCGWLQPHSWRWAGAAAVPALAALLILVARTPQTSTDIPVASTPPLPGTTAQILKPSPGASHATQPAISPHLPPTVAPRTAAASPSQHAAIASDWSTPVTPVAETPRTFIEVPHIQDTSLNSRTPDNAKTPASESDIAGKLVAGIEGGVRWINRQKPRLTLVSQTKRTERADVESGPDSIRSVARLSPLPTAPEIAARTVAGGTRIAAKFQEALDDFNRLRSDGIDELSGVVNDYRASLADSQSNNQNDNAAGDDDDDDLM